MTNIIKSLIYRLKAHNTVFNTNIYCNGYFIPPDKSNSSRLSFFKPSDEFFTFVSSGLLLQRDSLRERERETH